MRKYLIAAVLVTEFTAPAFAAERFYLAHEPANGGGLMVPFYGVLPGHPTPPSSYFASGSTILPVIVCKSRTPSPSLSPIRTCVDGGHGS